MSSLNTVSSNSSFLSSSKDPSGRSYATSPPLKFIHTSSPVPPMTEDYSSKEEDDGVNVIVSADDDFDIDDPRPSDKNDIGDLYRSSSDDHRQRTSSSDSTRFSFIQMDVEPGISRRYYIISYAIPVFLVSVAFALTKYFGEIQELDGENPSGIKRDIYTYVGAGLGLIGALGVFASSYTMVHWRMHPNPLIYWKMVADTMLSLVAISSQDAHSAPSVQDTEPADNTCNNSANDNCNVNVAALTQFCILSSETWFFLMAWDLFFSLRNPFTSYKNEYPKYHIFAWSAGFISAVILIAKCDKGVSNADICWVNDDIEGNMWDRNKKAILYLYLWIGIYFITSIVVFAIAMFRLNGGLKSTYHSRKYVLTRTSTILAIFMLYWFVMGCLYYFGIISPGTSDWGSTGSKTNVATVVIWTLLPAKGFITAIVWFCVNSLPSFLYHTFDKKGREKMKEKRRHYVGGDFSPQLNKALRREVLHFTTKGIIEAVKRNENLQPKHMSGMFTLAVNCEVAEFDIELEDMEADGRQIGIGDILGAPGDKSACRIVGVSATGASAADAASASPHIRGGQHRFPGFCFDVCRGACEQQIAATKRVKFKDYCPHVFAEIRKAHGIEPGSYVKSLRSTAKEKLSAGASGAFMFYTQDGKYLVKSTSQDELACLLKILVPYAEYLIDKKNRGSFLTRFYGCHSIRMYERDYSFVVMANIFKTSKVINQNYDIKGSWVSRHADPIVKGKKVRCRYCNEYFIYRGEGEDGERQPCDQSVTGCKPNVVLKDNDLNEKLRLEPNDAEHTIEQLVADSELLSSLGIMDYSLIIGVCNTEYEIQGHQTSTRWPGQKQRRGSLRTSIAPKVKKRLSMSDQKDRDASIVKDRQAAVDAAKKQRFHSGMSSTSGDDARASDAEQSMSGNEESASIKRLGRGAASDEADDSYESEFMMRSRCVVGPEYIFMGVIDMLQEWTYKKRLERFAKVIFQRVDGDGISALEPIAYKRRFQQKCRAIFEVDSWLLPEATVHFNDRTQQVTENKLLSTALREERDRNGGAAKAFLSESDKVNAARESRKVDASGGGRSYINKSGLGTHENV